MGNNSSSENKQVSVLKESFVSTNDIHSIVDKKTGISNCDEGVIIPCLNKNDKNSDKYIFCMSSQTKLFPSPRKKITNSKGTFEPLKEYPNDILIAIIKHKKIMYLNGFNVEAQQQNIRKIVNQFRDNVYFTFSQNISKQGKKKKDFQSPVEQDLKLTVLYGKTKLDLLHINSSHVVAIIPLLIRDPEWLILNRVFPKQSCKISNVILMVLVDRSVYLLDHKGNSNIKYNITNLSFVERK
jgi:hypothetical protein